MTVSLQKRIHTLVRGYTERYRGAWMVWCDPRGDWKPLLERIAADQRMGGFTLLSVEERTAGAVGGPMWRRRLQERIEANESFVLLVPAGRDELGWLWAHALLAEGIYSRSLRDQLVEWGWQPQNLTLDEGTVAVMARQGLQQDPAEWGGGGLQPSVELLLQVLVGDTEPDGDHRVILDLSTEAAGLPPVDTVNLPRWRAQALARLLVTQAHRAAPDVVPDHHELMIPAEPRVFALYLLDRWMDSLRLSRGLPNAIVQADPIAGLGSQVAQADARSGPFLSRAAERAVFVTTCTRLAEQSGKGLLESLAGLEEALARHAEGFWDDGTGREQALPWGELLRLSRAARLLLDGSPRGAWGKAEEAVEWYVSGGWRMDRAGEEFLRNLERPTHELLTLITPLRAAFRARWESSLIQWSDLWNQVDCPLPPFSSAGEWMKGVLDQSRATAVITVDAMRYDIGETLAEMVNQDEGATRASVRPARAPLPSVTALGMGMALPIAENELVAEVVEGKWQLHERGKTEHLHIAAQRRAWWQRTFGVPTDAFLSVAAVVNERVPEPSAQRRCLVIHDDALDKQGHDDELEAMGSGRIQERYRTAIKQLRDAGWRRILVVTDHGYIHWANGEERRVEPPLPDPEYLSRRAAAYPAMKTLDGPQGLAPGGRWRVAVPHGASSFRAYGGLGYFHGGASLQEWIIPCVQIEWPLQAKLLDVELEALPQILSQRPRVTLRIVRASLFIEEAIPREVHIVIRDAKARTILFRSGSVQITPDQQKMSVALNQEEKAEAERDTPLQIEVRDARTEEVLAVGASVLKIELSDW